MFFFHGKSSFCSWDIYIFVLTFWLNISRSKDNPAMKFGQLSSYNMRNIYLKNRTKNIVEKLVPDPFIKSQH